MHRLIYAIIVSCAVLAQSPACAKPDPGTATKSPLVTGDIDIRVRTFIPSPAVSGPPLTGRYFNGDNRSFSYSSGTSKGDCSAKIRPLGGEIIGENCRWGATREYTKDAIYHVEGKPWWWYDFKVGYAEKRQKTLELTTENLDLRSEATSGNTVTVLFHSAGANPLLIKSPEINVDARVSVKVENGHVYAKASGKHDCFPAIEIYAHFQPLFRWSPEDHDGGPASLVGGPNCDIPEMNWVDLGRWTIREPMRYSSMVCGGNPKKNGGKVFLSRLVKYIKAGYTKTSQQKAGQSATIHNVKWALCKEGVLFFEYVNGWAGPQLKKAYAAYQKRHYKGPGCCDGIPGWSSLTKLAKDYDFKAYKSGNHAAADKKGKPKPKPKPKPWPRCGNRPCNPGLK